jgi:hypothetical protein
MRGGMTSPYAPPKVDSSRGTAIGHPPVLAPPGARPIAPGGPPMYWRLLRLSMVRPNGWQRAVLVEGVIGLAVVLSLADVASAWTILVLPLVSMAVVKAHDYLAGLLGPLQPPEEAADNRSSRD